VFLYPPVCAATDFWDISYYRVWIRELILRPQACSGNHRSFLNTVLWENLSQGTIQKTYVVYVNTTLYRGADHTFYIYIYIYIYLLESLVFNRICNYQLDMILFLFLLLEYIYFCF